MPSRAIQRLVGPQVVVLEVEGPEPGVVPLEPVPLPVALEQPVLGDPVELVGQRHRVGLETGQHVLPPLRGPRRRPPRPPLRGPGPRRTSWRSRSTATAGRAPVMRPPSASSSSSVERQVPRHLAQRLHGRDSERSRGSSSSSIIASTIAVVPTFRNVAISDRLASPTITCSRRYFWASQCGSSRVLTIGRLSVVSRPTSSSKKSARCDSWNGTSPDDDAGRLAADLAGAGEDLAGHEERHDPVRRCDRTARRGPSGSSRGSRSCCPCRRCCSCGRGSPDPRAAAAGPPPWTRSRICSAARSHTTISRASAHSGVEQLGVGVVDVVAGAVGEHRVDEVRLDLGRHGPVDAEPAGVVPG